MITDNVISSAHAKLVTRIDGFVIEKTFSLDQHCLESWGHQIKVYDHISHNVHYEVPINATIVEYNWGN